MDFSIISLSIRDKRVYEALLAIPNSSLRAVAETTNINRGSTKVYAQEKLNAFTVKIGYPDKWKDYNSMIIDSEQNY